MQGHSIECLGEEYVSYLVALGIDKLVNGTTHTARNTAIACAQETTSVVAREPSFQSDLTAVRSRNNHGNTAHVCSHGLRGRAAARWTVWQRQVCSASDIIREVHLDIGQVHLVRETCTM